MSEPCKDDHFAEIFLIVGALGLLGFLGFLAFLATRRSSDLGATGRGDAVVVEPTSNGGWIIVDRPFAGGSGAVNTRTGI